MPETCIVCLGNLGDGSSDSSSVEGDNASGSGSVVPADPPPPLLNIHTDIKGYGLSTVINPEIPPIGTGEQRQDTTSTEKGKDKGKAKQDDAEVDPSMHIAHLLPCGHNMHDECLKPWVERANSCPICRRVFHRVELVAYIGGPVISSYKVEDRTQSVATTNIDLPFLADEEDALPPIQTQPCPVCGLDDNENVLLLCDGCDAPYHTYCIGLASVPSGAWFCENCELQRAIALSMQEQPPAARTPTGRRTRGEVRRNRRRRGMERAQWTRVWRGVWNQLSFDEHRREGETDAEYDRDEEEEDLDGEGYYGDDIHDHGSTYSDEERQREIEEGTFGFGTPTSPFEMYEIRQQVLMDRRAEIQADRRAWERRLQVAESQGRNRPTPHGGNASRFAETQRSLLAQQAEDRISGSWRSRPLERVKTPEPQTLEEIRAWELFDRAMAGDESPARTPRGRKRRAGTVEAEDREQGEETARETEQPSRPLKRPRTRRPEQLLAMRNNNTAAGPSGVQGASRTPASASATASTSTSAAAGSSAATPSAPSFLQSLLKEVEDNTSSPIPIQRPRPANVSRLPRPLIENSRKRSSVNRTGSPAAPYSGSSSNCSSPRYSHASMSPRVPGALANGSGSAATPPTSVSESPLASPNGSPILKNNDGELMTMFSPTEGSDSDAEMGDYQKSPTPTDSRRSAGDRRHRSHHHHHHQQQQQHPHLHRHRHIHQSSSSHAHSHHHRPTSPPALSYESKSLLQACVSAALKPHYHRKKINSSEYTDINRRVSRTLYERAGADDAVLPKKTTTTTTTETGNTATTAVAATAADDGEKKRKWWESVAKELVDKEIQSMFAKRGSRVPIPMQQGPRTEAESSEQGARRRPVAATTHQG